MRGGTSRGPFFLEDDLPADVGTRDRVLLAAMGSPDRRQIDGLGGARIATLAQKALLLSLESLVEDQRLRPTRLSPSAGSSPEPRRAAGRPPRKP